MARLNIEDCWWTDPRRSKLSKLLGSEEIADGTAVRMWRVAQEFWGRGRKLIPKDIFETIEAAPKLIEARLATVEGDQVYIRGSSQYLDWINEKRVAGQAGGKKSAEVRRKKHGSAQPNAEAPPKQPRTKSKHAEPSDSGSVSGSDSGSDSGSVSQITNSTKAAIAAYCERFKVRWGVNPQIQGKDAGIMGRVAKGMSPDRFVYLLDAYFSMPDAGVVKAKHPINFFELKMNEIVVFADSGKFTTMREAHQADNMATNVQLLQKIREGKV